MNRLLAGYVVPAGTKSATVAPCPHPGCGRPEETHHEHRRVRTPDRRRAGQRGRHGAAGQGGHLDPRPRRRRGPGDRRRRPHRPRGGAQRQRGGADRRGGQRQPAQRRLERPGAGRPGRPGQPDIDADAVATGIQDSTIDQSDTVEGGAAGRRSRHRPGAACSARPPTPGTPGAPATRGRARRHAAAAADEPVDGSVVVDSTGNIIGTLDSATGNVVAPDGTILGTLNEATGVVVDSAGNLIGTVTDLVDGATVAGSGRRRPGRPRRRHRQRARRLRQRGRGRSTR